MFDSKPSNLELEVAKLTITVQSLIEVNQALLRKLEQQQTLLGSIARFVQENSSGSAAFSVTR